MTSEILFFLPFFTKYLLKTDIVWIILYKNEHYLEGSHVVVFVHEMLLELGQLLPLVRVEAPQLGEHEPWRFKQIYTISDNNRVSTRKPNP